MTYIDTARKKKNGKVYERHLLRQSIREGVKVKHITLGNISSCSPEEIEAMKLALKLKGNLSELCSVKDAVSLQQKESVGAVLALYQVARRLGIEKALGSSREGKLALWQVIARVIDHGSRLSAVRLASEHAGCGILDLESFNEDTLYKNLDWLHENQSSIEKRLFRNRKVESSELFLYDVTSSYLEGEHNELADYGYNRDKKRGKKQIVIGLLCDSEGIPVASGVYPGNTPDLLTFSTQVHKLAKGFGCSHVTVVGDRGMIKSAQVEDLQRAGFHYITAITKPEIEGLVNKKVIQLDMFDDKLIEAYDGEIRYVLRRNPMRAVEISEGRLRKKSKIEAMVQERNEYLLDRSGAKVEVALRDVQARIEKLLISRWLKAVSKGRELFLEVDDATLLHESRFDGCYVLKTDLTAQKASKEVVHERYKDLSQVEDAFRTMKTAHLEVRPVHVRLAERTRAHVFVVMLAYIIVQELKKCWKGLNTTVEAGIASLSSLCGTGIMIKGVHRCLQIPKPRASVKKLLDSAKIILPEVLPNRGIKVTTKKSLAKRS